MKRAPPPLCESTSTSGVTLSDLTKGCMNDTPSHRLTLCFRLDFNAREILLHHGINFKTAYFVKKIGQI